MTQQLQRERDAMKDALLWLRDYGLRGGTTTLRELREVVREALAGRAPDPDIRDQDLIDTQDDNEDRGHLGATRHDARTTDAVVGELARHRAVLREILYRCQAHACQPTSYREIAGLTAAALRGEDMVGRHNQDLDAMEQLAHDLRAQLDNVARRAAEQARYRSALEWVRDIGIPAQRRTNPAGPAHSSKRYLDVMESRVIDALMGLDLDGVPAPSYDPADNETNFGAPSRSGPGHDHPHPGTATPWRYGTAGTRARGSTSTRPVGGVTQHALELEPGHGVASLRRS